MKPEDEDDDPPDPIAIENERRCREANPWGVIALEWRLVLRDAQRSIESGMEKLRAQWENKLTVAQFLELREEAERGDPDALAALQPAIDWRKRTGRDGRKFKEVAAVLESAVEAVKKDSRPAKRSRIRTGRDRRPARS